ncbi:MAG: 5-methylcytosine-specific restriction endonuclease system specificity protein McrC [Thermoguttaceae bacterium]|nr:5-methylcytosine-specific restriction endonuclease system specificity protein McrC [Thermoguttaceae bacterium]
MTTATTNDRSASIPIRNVYHMLTYAFRSLSASGFERVATEEFENAADLCAEILRLGLTSLLKRGLGREYLRFADVVASPRGKIDPTTTVKTLAMRHKRLACEFDEFSVNTTPNRVIKSTIALLLRAKIDPKRKKALRGLIVYLGDVDFVDLRRVDWSMRFDRDNGIYRALMGICRLIVEGLLQTESSGDAKLATFFDEQAMCRLYETFLLEYFKAHYPSLGARSEYIDWAVDDSRRDLLPRMVTDVSLSLGDRVLILDAKYYARSTQERFGSNVLISANLYQIFAYVENKRLALEKALGKPAPRVCGMLLYAKTDQEVVPNNDYSIDGRKISARSLDLNCEFSEIRAQLDRIVDEFFGVDKGC